MRSDGDALQQFTCRFIRRVLRHKFSTNGEVENLPVEPLRGFGQPIRRLTQRVSNLEQFLNAGNNASLLGEGWQGKRI